YSVSWSSVRVPIAYNSARNVTASPGVLCGCVLRVRRRNRSARRNVCRVARHRWGRACRSNASRLVLLERRGRVVGERDGRADVLLGDALVDACVVDEWPGYVVVVVLVEDAHVD